MTSTAELFLQTAFIVDDEAFKRSNAVPAVASRGDEEFFSAEPALLSVDKSPSREPYAVPTHQLDVEAVVTGFAEFGIVCGALAPKGTSRDEVQRVQRLAKRSDIVVLDWKLSSGAGKAMVTSLDFLSAIVAEDKSRGARLRLICVYTGEDNLSSIADEVEERLSSDGHSFDRDGTQLTRGPLRVIFLAKSRADGSEPAPSATSAGLAGEVVKQFDLFASAGLLPRLTLAALAALRDNAHRVLARFAEVHDPAFISHRALTSHLDAEQFVFSLLGEEFGSVISTVNVSQVVGDLSVEDRVSSMLHDRQEPRSVFRSKKPGVTSVSLVHAQNILLGNKVGGDKFEIAQGNQVAVTEFSSLSSLLLGDKAEDARALALEVDLGFSILSGLARDAQHDGESMPAPALQLGAILRRKRRGKDAEYFLCLQPLCDSVRLKQVTSFPMLPLKRPTEKSKAFDLVVCDRAGYVTLSSASKFAEIEMQKYGPNAELYVSATWVNDEGWRFRSGLTDYTWLGQLRPSKAQRIVDNVAAGASRVGLDEYEYLRMSSR